MADNLYISTYEAALALVATSMKKARLGIVPLMVNSITGGIFFTVGGMFHVMLIARLPDTLKQDPGIISLLEGFAYPIGLFFVVIMGSELFNSNVLYFSVGFVRGAVSIVDVVISLFVSWWLNLVANILVAYIICIYSNVFTTEVMVSSSKLIIELKASFAFHQTLIKGIAGNFFVSLGVYLQIMARPIHVKFILIFLPVFIFVSLGFTHSVADMFVVIMGLINGSNISVGTAAWKILLPGVIGNLIGGSLFGIVIPWYSHIYLIEHDQKTLKLPRYDLRDEQPQINMDSRVVRQRSNSCDDEKEEIDELKHEEDEVLNDLNQMRSRQDDRPTDHKDSEKTNSNLSTESDSLAAYEPKAPEPIYSNEPDEVGSRLSTITTGASLRSNRSLTKTRSRGKSFARSPKNVFPVMGMGDPLHRERSIASGFYDAPDIGEIYDDDQDFNDLDGTSAKFIGTKIRNLLGRRFLHRSSGSDLERQSKSRSPSPHLQIPHQQSSSPNNLTVNIPNNRSATGSIESIHDPLYNPNPTSSVDSISVPSPRAASPARQISLGSQKSTRSEKNSYNNRKANAAITSNAHEK